MGVEINNIAADKGNPGPQRGHTDEFFHRQVAPPPYRRLLHREDPRPSVLPERPNDAADGRRGRRVMATDGARAWQLDPQRGRPNQ